LKAVLPELATLLAQGPGAAAEIRMLVGES